MIRFRCHRCKRPLAVPDRKFVGKKVKCPGCSITTIVPDIPGAKEAKAKAQTKAAAAAESEFVDAAQVIDDPLAQLAGITDGYAVEDDSYAPRAAPPLRQVASRNKSGTAFMMLFGMLLFLAGVAGAVITAIKHAQVENPALLYSLSGAGIVLGLIFCLVGVLRA